MKKIFLLFVSVVLAGALVISCAQPESPSSLTITNTIPVIEGVAADSIKAESVAGGILVTWGGGPEATGYQIWRRELGTDGGPVEGTAGRLGGSQIRTSPVKKIPFYWDTQIKNGTSYQYGIVLSGYKSGTEDAQPKSEIVWQAEDKSTPGQGYFNAITDPKTELKVSGSKVTATVKNINTWSGNNTTANQVDRPETAEITISGLEFGYTYRFYIQFYNGGTALINGSQFGGDSEITPNWKTNLDPNAGYNVGSSIPYGRTTGLQWGGGTYVSISPIENYVDTGSWDVPIVIPYNLTTIGGGYSLNDYSPATAFAYWQARIYAEIGVDTGKYYLSTTEPGANSGLTRTQKELAKFSATF